MTADHELVPLIEEGATLDGTVVDPDAAWLLERVPAAMGSVRRTLEEWLAIGERLATVRERIPSDPEYGRWCKQYNWFGSAERKENLSNALAGYRYFYSANCRVEDLGTKSIHELAKRQQQAEKQAKRAARAAIEAPKDLHVRLAVGDFREALADITCDAIITDPPYPREYLPLYKDLAEWAAQALTPGGLLAVMCGQSYLPELMALMDGPLPYRWTIAYLTPGGQAVQLWDRQVNTFWKPVIVYGRSADGGRWFGDVTRSAVNDNDKTHHEWGQSESGMADLVDRLTEPGQTVADPFMGAGTTGVVSVALGRHFIGCDIDPEHVATAKRRIG